jgi:DNA polymerase III subunit chi
VPAAATPRVDFYVLPGTEARARLKFACRIAEKAYLADQRVFVWLEDAAEMQSFDELLWTFADRSFVPHEIYSDAQQWQHTPVLLGCEAQPQQPFDVLLNLGSEVPAAAAHAVRIAEIVDAEEPRRRAGRDRFRHYRDRGLAPETHNIATEETP